MGRDHHSCRSLFHLSNGILASRISVAFILSGLQRHLILAAVRHEADAHNTKDHHSPSGRMGLKAKRKESTNEDHNASVALRFPGAMQLMQAMIAGASNMVRPSFFLSSGWPTNCRNQSTVMRTSRRGVCMPSSNREQAQLLAGLALSTEPAFFMASDRFALEFPRNIAAVVKRG